MEKLNFETDFDVEMEICEGEDDHEHDEPHDSKMSEGEDDHERDEPHDSKMSEGEDTHEEHDEPHDSKMSEGEDDYEEHDEPHSSKITEPTRFSSPKNLSTVSTVTLCRFFAKGGCQSGEKCTFLHQEPQPGPSCDVINRQGHVDPDLYPAIDRLKLKLRKHREYFLELLMNDMKVWDDGNFWPLSCCAPIVGKATLQCFKKDISFEQVKARVRKNKGVLPLDVAHEIRNILSLRKRLSQDRRMAGTILDEFLNLPVHTPQSPGSTIERYRGKLYPNIVYFVKKQPRKDNKYEFWERMPRNLTKPTPKLMRSGRREDISEVDFGPFCFDKHGHYELWDSDLTIYSKTNPMPTISSKLNGDSSNCMSSGSDSSDSETEASPIPTISSEMKKGVSYSLCSESDSDTDSMTNISLKLENNGSISLSSDCDSDSDSKTIIVPAAITSKLNKYISDYKSSDLNSTSNANTMRTKPPKMKKGVSYSLWSESDTDSDDMETISTNFQNDVSICSSSNSDSDSDSKSSIISAITSNLNDGISNSMSSDSNLDSKANPMLTISLEMKPDIYFTLSSESDSDSNSIATIPLILENDVPIGLSSDCDSDSDSLANAMPTTSF